MAGTSLEWEKLSILLNLLVATLPAPKGEDLAKGILETIASAIHSRRMVLIRRTSQCRGTCPAQKAHDIEP